LIGFQLIADRFATSGAFSASAWGTAPFGGQDYPVTIIPPPQYGSDDLTADTAQNMADMVLTRKGQTVSVRPYAAWGSWRVNYALICGAEVAALRVYALARVFYLLPAGDPQFSRKVYWADGAFKPERIGPDAYALSFTLEQMAV